MNHAHHREPRRSPQRREERNAVLKIDDNVIVPRVSPEVTCGCRINAELAAFADHEVAVRPVVGLRSPVGRREERDCRSGADEPLGDLLGVGLGAAGLLDWPGHAS